MYFAEYMFAINFWKWKQKASLEGKLLEEIFLWRHQFILFCFCSSACMLHHVLVILEAGKQLIFWVPISFEFMNVDPETNVFLIRYCLFLFVVFFVVFFLFSFFDKKVTSMFSNWKSQLPVRFRFFSFRNFSSVALFNVTTNPNRFPYFATVSII